MQVYQNKITDYEHEYFAHVVFKSHPEKYDRNSVDKYLKEIKINLPANATDAINNLCNEKILLLRQIKIIIQYAYKSNDEVGSSILFDILNQKDHRKKENRDTEPPKRGIEKYNSLKKIDIHIQKWNFPKANHNKNPESPTLGAFIKEHCQYLGIDIRNGKFFKNEIIPILLPHEIWKESSIMKKHIPLNRIFYGPPGTGKTYHTINAALEVLIPEKSEEFKNIVDKEERRKTQKAEFDKLLEMGRISFVTFHQSFSYEDFVEGIRPDVEKEEDKSNNSLSYDIKPGIFKKICEAASNSITTKHSLKVGQTVGNYTVEKISSDVLILQKPRAESKLPLPFLIIDKLVELVQSGEISISDIVSKNVFQKLDSKQIVSDMEKYIVNGYPQPLGNIVETLTTNAVKVEKYTEPYVLIIDEINRGNISGIFGELITLIEPSKRLGAEEELKVTLPYSRDTFGVPKNLYIIGTMNTADRSLTGLDISLRRRFTFVEMPPDYELLEYREIEGTKITVADLLLAMNERIEFLLGRDYCLGHAAFMHLKDDVGITIEDLKPIFKNTIIPLLQEYFFEDWRKIHLILNDHKKDEGFRFIKEKKISQNILDDEEFSKSPRRLWEINKYAFDKMESYVGIADLTRQKVRESELTNENNYELPVFVKIDNFKRIMNYFQDEEYYILKYETNNEKINYKIYVNEVEANTRNGNAFMSQVDAAKAVITKYELEILLHHSTGSPKVPNALINEILGNLRRNK